VSDNHIIITDTSQSGLVADLSTRNPTSEAERPIRRGVGLGKKSRHHRPAVDSLPPSHSSGHSSGTCAQPVSPALRPVSGGPARPNCRWRLSGGS